MLKRDKEAFKDFVSSDNNKREEAARYFNNLELGHFEDHPPSKTLVKEHISSLEEIVTNSKSQIETEWAIQFCADVEYINLGMKPLIYKLISSDQCNFIPTILWGISQNSNDFTDVGELLKKLTSHKDREVRWRIPYVMLQMPEFTPSMMEALDMLKYDEDKTTQLYIKQCQNSKKWPKNV